MKSKTNKILIISSVVSVLGIIFLYIAYSQIGKLNITNDELALEISSLYTQAIRAESLKKIVSNVGDKGITLEGYFIKSGEEVEFVKKMEALAESVRLNYTTNSISTASNDKLDPLNKEYLELSMITEGSWQNTRRFLSLLEKMPMNVKFNGVDMKTEIRASAATTQPTTAPTVSSTTPSASRNIWRANISIIVVKNK